MRQKREMKVYGITVIYYDDYEDCEQNTREWVETMIDDYSDDFENVKTIDTTIGEEDGAFMIDDGVYEYVGGRLYRSEGDYKVINGSLYKKVK